MIDARKPTISARRLAIATVYGAAFLQGLTMVSFPASSAVLKEVHGLSDAQYGAIFLPQVALAIVGAVGGGALARRLGLKALLVATLAANGVSQLFLAGSVLVASAAAFAMVMAGTACLGLGFGIGGAPLNSYPPLFFPRHHHTAIVALHTLLGLGLAAGPLLVGELVQRAAWAGFPLLLLVLALALTGVVARPAFPECEPGSPPEHGPVAGVPLSSPVFWLFVLTTVLYAVAEGTFSNWVVIYLQEGQGLPAVVAALALSVFWGAIVAGRLLVSVLVLWIPARLVWLTLPILMIAAFLLLPYADNQLRGIGLFALAGLACSAFFPLTIGLAAERFPGHAAWVSAMMVGAVMAGVGLGSFAIGPLRQWLSFEQLYRLAALYPLGVIILALAVLRAGAKKRPGEPHAVSMTGPDAG
jgi:fucose permease